ncbi:hypothetical protein F4819DRAFT_490849 [Hypoxylon fuscum]|nr:hypothetical protein F4819DRAFT_490849 [Hypoxylon fuscum]
MKPVIFQFSLGDKWMQDMVDLQYTHQQGNFTKTIRKLSEKFTVQPAWDAKQAFDLLSYNQAPHAILITDPGITEPENEELSRQVVNYARDGGTVILSLCFSSNVNFDDFSSYMKGWGLHWKVYSYTRQDCVVNTLAVGPPGVQWMYDLPALYGSKSVFLSNVAPEACWYLPAPYIQDEYDDEEEIQAPPPRKETPFAFSKVGKGFVGFTGDVNQHEATDAAILAMLGMDYPWCTCGKEQFV